MQEGATPRRWIRRLHRTYHRATLLSTSGLASLPATFTTGEAVAHGVHPRDLYAARDSGAIIELSRGVFRHAEAPLSTYPDFLAVAHRAPRAIVCLVSAAAVHDLTDEIPAAVQIAVPKPSRPPQIAFPPTKVFRFDPRTFELGLSSVEVDPARACSKAWPWHGQAHPPACRSRHRWPPSTPSLPCGTHRPPERCLPVPGTRRPP